MRGRIGLVMKSRSKELRIIQECFLLQKAGTSRLTPELLNWITLLAQLVNDLTRCFFIHAVIVAASPAHKVPDGS
jgi:hypothetical protein